MTIIFDVLTKRDARLLMKWWNANTRFYHFIRRSESNPRFWALVRQ